MAEPRRSHLEGPPEFVAPLGRKADQKATATFRTSRQHRAPNSQKLMRQTVRRLRLAPRCLVPSQSQHLVDLVHFDVGIPDHDRTRETNYYYYCDVERLLMRAFVADYTH